ncbi:VOC family protein [Endozoicomonas ascidiicola]|uniref:VOC family protein n=1 Tax=Endozoicomonas ascidiicola TaxID=1698521 RepID=UPI0008362B1A
MIHLEHVNLVVSHLEKSLEFYQAAFPHWRIRGGGEGEWYGRPRKWVHLGDDYQYIAISDHGQLKSRDLKGSQPGLAHFAYVTDNIDRLVKRMLDAGFEETDSGGDEEHRKNRYFLDPDGIEVEFVEYLTDDTNQRNVYS